MRKRWPRALVEDEAATAPLAAAPSIRRNGGRRALRIVMIGTISRCGCGKRCSRADGRATTYSDIARISASNAARAVGRRSDATRSRSSSPVIGSRALWRADRLPLGLARKQAIIGWEAAHPGG